MEAMATMAARRATEAMAAMAATEARRAMAGWLQSLFGGSTPPKPETLIEEWRKITLGQKEKELKFVKDFQPYNKEVKELRVLLHGPTGAGKSSFINSVDSALRGRITGRALADTTSGTSFTKQRRTFKFNNEGPGTFYPFVFTDIMGLQKNNYHGVLVEDIKLDMKGHINDGYEFNPCNKISEDDPHYNKSPTVGDKVHVLVCVIDGTSSQILDDESRNKMRDVRLAARDLGIPQLVVLTKIDEACPAVRSDIKNVCRSRNVKEMVDQITVHLGLQPNCIFPVKNYNTEMETNDVIDTLILSAMKRIITFGEDFVDQQST